MRGKTLVVGGSGFIGNAIQRNVLEQEICNSFIFTYNENAERIHGRL